jgi:hypothetical protein
MERTIIGSSSPRSGIRYPAKKHQQIGGSIPLVGFFFERLRSANKKYPAQVKIKVSRMTPSLTTMKEPALTGLR